MYFFKALKIFWVGHWRLWSVTFLDFQIQFNSDFNIYANFLLPYTLTRSRETRIFQLNISVKIQQIGNIWDLYGRRSTVIGFLKTKWASTHRLI